MGTHLSGMEFSDLLQTVAQISASFAGFTAIIVAFQADPNWGKAQAIGLAHFLQLSLGVVFLSLTPIVLYSISALTEYIWRISNGLLGIYHLYVMWWMTRRRRDSSPYMQLGALTWIFGLIGFASITTNIAVGAGIAPSFHVFAFLAGLLWLLAMALLNFVTLLLHRMRTGGNSGVHL